MAYFMLFLPLIFNNLEKFPLVLHPAIKKDEPPLLGGEIAG
jgi:hypothetical protein